MKNLERYANVRIDPELKRRLHIYTITNGMSLKTVIDKLVKRFLNGHPEEQRQDIAE